jgi:plastocyanin
MFRLLVIILVVIAGSGCISLKYDEPEKLTSEMPAPTSFPISEPSTVYVEIRGSEFSPLELNVINGTTVKWRNFDSAQHAVMVDNVSSPPFGNRESWSHTFNRTGSYIYNCSINTWMTQGLIIVK